MQQGHGVGHQPALQGGQRGGYGQTGAYTSLSLYIYPIHVYILYPTYIPIYRYIDTLSCIYPISYIYPYIKIYRYIGYGQTGARARGRAGAEELGGGNSHVGVRHGI